MREASQKNGLERCLGEENKFFWGGIISIIYHKKVMSVCSKMNVMFQRLDRWYSFSEMAI